MKRGAAAGPAPGVLLGLSVLLFLGCAGTKEQMSSLPGMGGGATGGVRVSSETGKGIYATFETSRGDIVVRLFEKEAPETVDNFVALATGGRQWTDPRTGRKTKARLYDGTHFFRVIPGFMIQGGDPTNTGAGGPGYKFKDENFPGMTFNRAGLLAMANSGPRSNGSQFFITLGPTPWLDGKHTIFGEVVSGQEVVRAIAAAARIEVDSKTGRNIDRPIKPQILKKVRIADSP